MVQRYEKKAKVVLRKRFNYYAICILETEVGRDALKSKPAHLSD